MKRQNLGCSIVKLLLAIAVVAMGFSAASAGTPRPQALLLNAAEDFGDYARAVPPPPGTPSTSILLPMYFPIPHPNRGVSHWLRLSFPFDPAPDRPLGLYITRIAPGAALYINGTLVGRTMYFGEPEATTWYYPFFVDVPNTLLRKNNELLIQLAAPSFDLFGVRNVWIGDAAPLRQDYSTRLFFQTTGVELVSFLAAAIGLLTFTLWIRRRFDTVFGWFSLSCVVWVLRNSQFYVIREYSIFDFWVITDAALFWLVAVLYVVSFRIIDRRHPWIERGFFAYAAISTLAMYLAGPPHKDDVTTTAYLFLLPTSVAFIIFLSREALRSPSVLLWLLWLAAIVTGVSGALDTALMIGLFRGLSIYVMPYASLFYTLTVGWALVDRFIKIHNDTELLNRDLAVRVQQREQQLAEEYIKTAALVREQATQDERGRILRDMHDGLGLHLITARRLIETETVSQERIAGLLGDAMDELRIAIDSMKSSGEDLLVMLGNLRYRLEPRLNASGIQLHWEIDPTVDLSRLSPMHVMEITRIVQELCANAIKHSHASEMFLAVVSTKSPQGDSGLSIRVSDNGVGFDVNEIRPGEGLRNIRRRAQHMGASLQIRSQPGETIVSLLFS